MFNGSNCARKSKLSGLLTEPLNPREFLSQFIINKVHQFNLSIPLGFHIVLFVSTKLYLIIICKTTWKVTEFLPQTLIFYSQNLRNQMWQTLDFQIYGICTCTHLELPNLCFLWTLSFLDTLKIFYMLTDFNQSS